MGKTKRDERARRVTNEPDFKAVSTNNRVPVEAVRVPFIMVRLRTVLALSRRCLSSSNNPCHTTASSVFNPASLRLTTQNFSTSSLIPQQQHEDSTETHIAPEGELSQSETDPTFASLLRNSTFVQMGNPVGKVVVGRVFHVVDNDLYINFGFKFPCVCRKPSKSRTNYHRGTMVRVLIKDLEMSEKFLGFDKPMTILEADCVLLGPYTGESRYQDP